MNRCRNLFSLGLLACCILLVQGCATKGPWYSQAQSTPRTIQENDPNAIPITSVHHLPGSVKDRLGFIADTGEKFDAGCSQSRGVPYTRFLGAVQAGSTYVVAIEEGGFVYRWYFTDYTLSPDGRVASERLHDPVLAQKQ
jgi:hypothetical protein